MQFLLISKQKQDVTEGALRPVVKKENSEAWKMSTEGVLRSLWYLPSDPPENKGPGGSVCLLECADEAEARRQINRFPLVQNGNDNLPTARTSDEAVMDLAALADFNLVAAHGGFGAASRASGRPKTSLSRRVRELEESLGVRLVERGRKSFRLTEAGRSLHGRTDGLLGEISEVGAALTNGLATPRGLLRISAPVLFCHVAMGRIAADFARAYPDVQLDLTAEDREVDLVEEGYDLVIRINPKPDAHLVGRCFVRDETLVVAPASMPRPEADAVCFAAVMTNAASEGPWTVAAGDDVILLHPKARVRASSLLVIRDAVLAGAGAARLPSSMVGADLRAGRLACWGKVPDRVVELWVLHTSRRLASTKVSAFVEFLCAAFPDRMMPFS